MVTAGKAARAMQRLAAVLRRDLTGFVASVWRPPAVRTGLYTYRTRPRGGLRRIHLRVHDDGSSLLLVDATDAVHLNPSATIVAKLALEGASLGQAVGSLRRLYRGIEPNRIALEVAEVYHAVHHLATTGDGCTTCGLVQLARVSPFGGSARAPYKADLALTYGCNNACRHCYNPRERSGMPALDPAGWRRVVERVAKVGIPHVIFTGGEPTIVPSLPGLVAQAEHLGLITGLNTNGRRLADRRFAESLAGAGLSHVQITLESDRPKIHDAMTGARSFGETVQGIRNALACGLYTITNTTLTRRNTEEPESLADFLHKLGLRTFAINGMIYSGSGRTADDAIPEAQMGPLLVRLRDRAAELGLRMLWYTPTAYCRLSPVELGLDPRRCNAGEYSICIEPNGDVLPCQSYYEPVGNLLVDPWETIWNSGLFQSFRDRTADPQGCGLPVACWDCLDLELCGGGCRIEREALVLQS